MEVLEKMEVGQKMDADGVVAGGGEGVHVGV